jgi:hypothetical protein
VPPLLLGVDGSVLPPMRGLATALAVVFRALDEDGTARDADALPPIEVRGRLPLTADGRDLGAIVDDPNVARPTDVAVGS